MSQQQTDQQKNHAWLNGNDNQMQEAVEQI